MTNYNQDHLPKFQRGETFQWAYDGDVDTEGALVGTLTAEIKASFDGRPPADSIAADLVPSITTTNDTGEGEKGFIITGSAAQTASLVPNRYILITKYATSIGTQIDVIDDFVVEFGQ